MKKLTQPILFAFLFVFIQSCYTVKPVEPIGVMGCWYEPASKDYGCGTAQYFSRKDSVYSMRTRDGWMMHIKASEISW